MPTINKVLFSAIVALIAITVFAYLNIWVQ